VIAYVPAVEASQVPEPKEWLGRYADLAPKLEAFFAAQAQVDGLAATMRREPGAGESVSARSARDDRHGAGLKRQLKELHRRPRPARWQLLPGTGQNPRC
jgi:hypothetical protein